MFPELKLEIVILKMSINERICSTMSSNIDTTLIK